MRVEDPTRLFRIDGTFAAVGQQALAIGQTLGTVQGYPQLHRFVEVRPGGVYRLTAAVRTRELAPRSRDAVGASVEVIEWSDAVERGLKVHESYVQLAVRFDADGRATFLPLFVQLTVADRLTARCQDPMAMA